MLIVLFGSGLLGCFFYHAMLFSLSRGDLKRTWLNWFACVGGSAFLLAISSSVAAQYFGADASLWLSVALWPMIALALHGGYRASSGPVHRQHESLNGESE